MYVAAARTTTDAAVAAPAGEGPRAATGQRLLSARPGASGLLHAREECKAEIELVCWSA